jgi:hypothetical protein
MYQPGFLAYVKHMVPQCVVSLLLLETWVHVLWHEVLGVFFTC